MITDIYSWSRMLEAKLLIANSLNLNRHQYRSRYIVDPLSQSVCDKVPRYHKLEVLILALTLLRYNDVCKLNLPDFLNGNEQIIKQGKTKEQITIPPLFLVSSSLTAIKSSDVTLFTDSYDKLRYTLKQCIPTELRSHLNTERSVTHIFRFLRSTFYYLTDKDYFKASKYLGHKNPESIKNYVPRELLNYYSHHLSKG